MRTTMAAIGIVAALLVFAAPAPAHFFTDEAIEDIAPVVIFHDDELYHPSSGEEFLDHSGLAWNHDGGCPRQYHRKRFRGGVETPWSEAEMRRLGEGGFAQRLRAPRSASPGSCRELDGDAYLFDTTELTRPYEKRDGSSPLGKAEGWYLDLANTHRAGFPDSAKGGVEYETAAPTYFDDGLLYRNGSPTGSAFVTFWFFYNYNDGLGPQNHEGDWEDISIRLERVGDREWRPVQVFYAKHGNKPLLFLKHPDIVRWDQAYRIPFLDGGRLGVFSAKGSHGSYGNGVPPWKFADRIDRDGPTWTTWRQLRFLWDQSWSGYCGAWGRVGSISDTTGPLGPGCLGPDHRPIKTGRPGEWGASRVIEPGTAFENTIALEG
jgi:hypothetical protein